MKKRIGLVLAGGGGKGAYQIGVWKALKELGISRSVQAVSGTSVGALNAALFVQGNLTLAEKLWQSISENLILSKDPREISAAIEKLGYRGGLTKPTLDFALEFSKKGLFSQSGLLTLMQSHLNLALISRSPILFYATCCMLPEFKPVYFTLNGHSKTKILSILLASSALPGIFEPVEIDGIKYIDGGVPVPMGDNIPVHPLYRAGYKTIIVVHLERKKNIDPSQFPSANLIEIIPERDLGDLLNGTLDFSAEGARWRMDMGYKDAKRCFT